MNLRKLSGYICLNVRVKDIGPRHKAFLGSENNVKHDNPPTIAPASHAPRLLSVRGGKNWAAQSKIGGRNEIFEEVNIKVVRIDS